MFEHEHEKELMISKKKTGCMKTNAYSAIKNALLSQKKRYLHINEMWTIDVRYYLLL